MEKRYVIDARNPRTVQGPFPAGQAEKLAFDLSQFVLRNGPLGFLGGTATGPFFAVTQKGLSASQRATAKRLLCA